MIQRREYFLKLYLFVFFILHFYSISAQEKSANPFFWELHIAAQGSFGPSETQAEIAGGVDSMSYDNKKHFSPGFKGCFPLEMSFGFNKLSGDTFFRCVQFQSTVSYFKQDIGMVQLFGNDENPFVLADMLSIRAAVLLQLSDFKKRGVHGLYVGLFIGSHFPVAIDMNEQTKAEFGIRAFSRSAMFYWGADYKYSLRIGRQGWFASTGASVIMPGTVGYIGKIELDPSSGYEIIRDEVRMYSIKAFLGIGIQLGIKKRDEVMK